MKPSPAPSALASASRGDRDGRAQEAILAFTSLILLTVAIDHGAGAF